MKTIIDYAIESLQKLQINMLEVIIPDNAILQKTSKEIYLAKIDGIFNLLKNRKYTVLNYTTLPQLPDVYVFFTTDHLYSFCVLIKPAADNNSLATFEFLAEHLHVLLPDLYNTVIIKVQVFKDEYVDFIPTNKCLNETRIYESAIQAFSNYQTIKQEDLQVIENWMDEYGELYDAITPNKLQYSQHYYFYKLYNLLLDITTAGELAAEFTLANDSFNIIDKIDEGAVQDWYERYEYLLLELGAIQADKLLQTIDSHNKYLRFSIDELFCFWIDKSIFDDIIVFYDNLKYVKDRDLLMI
jgi:hypothetical protein